MSILMNSHITGMEAMFPLVYLLPVPENLAFLFYEVAQLEQEGWESS